MARDMKEGMKRWDHQVRGLQEFIQAVRDEKKRIVLTSPTGMGKTVIARDIADWIVNEQGGKVVLYTNRRMLLDQLSGVIGLEHGIRCAGYETDFDSPLQIASIQTENSRSVAKDLWELHRADVAIVDEAHMMKGETATRIINRHVNNGGIVLGMTATPLDLEDIYEHLIVAGTNSEGRACGALVPAVHYGVDEPDLGKIKGIQLGKDLSENQNRKAMGQVVDGKPNIRLQKLVGRVFEWYRRLNPQGNPTILFAPGVKESIWFAEQFTEAGVSAAHIDGREVWYQGEYRETNKDSRDFIMEGSRNGSIQVLCNRFVLREGIDAPWLQHGIFATVFGSLQSYLQSGGRLLRNYRGISNVTVQDHGGNWWRHGSLNIDRQWPLGLSATAASGMWKESFCEPTEPKPFLCPGCQNVLVWRDCGNKIAANCPTCGHKLDFTKRSRPVLQDDGSLVLHGGDGYKAKPTRKNENTESLWEKMFWRARNSKSMTFTQAIGFFEVEYGYRPPKTMKFMPTRLVDFWRKVSEVPVHTLRKDSQ